jgi:hypothetical protein
MKRGRKIPRRRHACKRALPQPQADGIRDWSGLDCPPLTLEVLDLAVGLVRSNSGECGIILTRAGEPKVIYPPLWARNGNLGPKLEDERS